MMPLRHTDALLEEEKSILLTLLYFDIFDYPLTESEIASFAPATLRNQWQSSLVMLINKKIIFSFDEFYSLKNEASLASRRKAGNLLAQKKMKVARVFSALISHFPFVRAVMLSGSISKGYMDEKSDIDYFIITAPGRLWLVRGALALFRRVFLLNSHKFLCTNYFVDDKNLEIEEKNIFTAIEASTLKPMVGKKYVYEFQAANQWCRQYLPNHQPENEIKEERDSIVKKAGEKVFSKQIFDRIDRWAMKKFVSHWNTAYQHLLNQKDFSIAFQSDEHVSRSHPQFYQKKVLSNYQQKIREFEYQNSISLDV